MSKQGAYVFSDRLLARISHKFSTAADIGALTALRSFRLLDVLFLLTLAVARLSGQSQDPSWEQIRRVAEAEHEIVALAIRRHDFHQVLPEMRRMYALGFPERYEATLSREIEIVSDSLMHEEQYDLAHQIIDEGLLTLKLNQSKAAILRKKAYILKKQGKEEEALKYFKQSVSLESGK